MKVVKTDTIIIDNIVIATNTSISVNHLLLFFIFKIIIH